MIPGVLLSLWLLIAICVEMSKSGMSIDMTDFDIQIVYISLWWCAYAFLAKGGLISLILSLVLPVISWLLVGGATLYMMIATDGADADRGTLIWIIKELTLPVAFIVLMSMIIIKGIILIARNEGTHR